MPRKLPRYCCSDRDAKGRLRLYVRKPGERKIRIRAEYGTDAFWVLYRDAMAGKIAPKELPHKPVEIDRKSLRGLCVAYFLSAEYARLAPRTRQIQRLTLERVCAHRNSKGDAFGTLPYARMEYRHVKSLRDAYRDKPEAANQFVKVLRNLFAWAMEVDLARENPARDVKKFPSSGDGFAAWSLADVHAFTARHPRGTPAYLALALMAYYGLRRSDVWRIGPANIVDGNLVFAEAKNAARARKTHRMAWLPELAAIVAETPHHPEAFVTTQAGKPFGSKESFGNIFAAWCREAGLKGLSAHGLRKFAMAEFAESGATNLEAAAVSGHRTTRMVDHYARSANRERLANEALAKRGIVPLEFAPPSDGAKSFANSLESKDKSP